jgi:hypothetical protein
MKKRLQFLSLLAFSAFGFAALQAQAPAGAPAGATGICKDGSYSTMAKKGGACRGHKGVQTWYSDSTTEPVTSTAGKPSAVHAQPAPMSAPQDHPAVAPTAAPPMAAPIAAAAGGKRLSPTQAAAARPVAPGGGPGMVWANEDSKVYHCIGDPFYGRTKKGMYLSESDAQGKGYHGARGKTCVVK